MDLSFPALLAAVRFTVQDPRAGARMVMQAGVPVAARWIALGIMAILSAVLAHVSFGLMPPQVRAQLAAAMASPFRTAIFQAVLMLFATHAIVWIGRWRGGSGTFNDALILMVWLQFILLVLQLVQIAFQILLPPVADVVGFLSVAVFLWLLCNFIAEVHGFKSVGMVFFGVMATLLAMGFVLALVMLPFMETGVR